MMELRILGPLEVVDGGRPVSLGGARQRAVLAILLLHRGEVVSVDRLADELWGEEPPGTATKTVQVYVSRLRKTLGHDVLLTRAGGYLLDIQPEQLDAARSEQLAGEGRRALARGDARTARELLGQALDLWRGPPLADLGYEPFAQAAIARLEELRLVALEHRIEADLALGDHAALIPELETLVREHPARERLRAQLILALYRSGRQTDALASYGPRSEAARAGRQQLFTQPSLSVYSFVFNTRRGPFADRRLRQAVNFAMDRRALAAHTGGGESGRPTDQFIPPGLPGFEDAAVYPLGGPDLESARRLADGRRRQAVLYTCNLPGCTRHGQILKSNLRAIGIDLTVRQSVLGEMFERIRNPSEPFDIAYWNWFVDYADPSGYINAQFARDGALPGLFADLNIERRMAATASLTGDARLRAYAKLDRDLAANAAPAAAFATGTASYFLSARMGCQVLHPLFGLDLAALCVRR
jgi:DNA-binding SARP family transcriptional activator